MPILRLQLQLATIEIETLNVIVIAIAIAITIVNKKKMHSSQKGIDIKKIFIGRWGCLTIMNFCSFTNELSK